MACFGPSLSLGIFGVLQACAHVLLLCRTTAISIVRLRLLNKRFGASAEDRYELAIQAVTYSVIEAHLAIICANLPTLGYQAFSDWVGENRHRRVSGSDRRRVTIGLFPNPGHNEESTRSNDMAEHHRPYQYRYIE